MPDANKKRMVRHPLYPWLYVDRRTQREVDGSRELKPLTPINRLARRARKLGKSLNVKRDLDGAYRLGIRLDGEAGRTG